MNTKDKDRKVEGMVEALHYAAVDNEYGDCDECTHFHCWEEHHPYGEGTAAERLCECRVPDAKDCPVVEEIVSALYAHVHVVEKKEKSDA